MEVISCSYIHMILVEWRSSKNVSRMHYTDLRLWLGIGFGLGLESGVRVRVRVSVRGWSWGFEEKRQFISWI